MSCGESIGGLGLLAGPPLAVSSQPYKAMSLYSPSVRNAQRSVICCSIIYLTFQRLTRRRIKSHEKSVSRVWNPGIRAFRTRRAVLGIRGVRFTQPGVGR